MGDCLSSCLLHRDRKKKPDPVRPIEPSWNPGEAQVSLKLGRSKLLEMGGGAVRGVKSRL